MTHVDIEAVLAKAEEFEAFARTVGLDAETAADYQARAANLLEFAHDLARWR